MHNSIVADIRKLLILGQFADTLEKHIEEICHYFVNKTTSGVMEGINNKIKLIIIQSYAFKTFDSLQEKLLVCLLITHLICCFNLTFHPLTK